MIHLILRGENDFMGLLQMVGYQNNIQNEYNNSKNNHVICHKILYLLNQLLEYETNILAETFMEIFITCPFSTIRSMNLSKHIIGQKKKCTILALKILKKYIDNNSQLTTEFLKYVVDDEQIFQVYEEWQGINPLFYQQQMEIQNKSQVDFNRKNTIKTLQNSNISQNQDQEYIQQELNNKYNQMNILFDKFSKSWTKINYKKTPYITVKYVTRPDFLVKVSIRFKSAQLKTVSEAFYQNNKSKWNQKIINSQIVSKQNDQQQFNVSLEQYQWLSNQRVDKLTVLTRNIVKENQDGITHACFSLYKKDPIYKQYIQQNLEETYGEWDHILRIIKPKENKKLQQKHQDLLNLQQNNIIEDENDQYTYAYTYIYESQLDQDQDKVYNNVIDQNNSQNGQEWEYDSNEDSYSWESQNTLPIQETLPNILQNNIECNSQHNLQEQENQQSPYFNQIFNDKNAQNSNTIIKKSVPIQIQPLTKRQSQKSQKSKNSSRQSKSPQFQVKNKHTISSNNSIFSSTSQQYNKKTRSISPQIQTKMNTSNKNIKNGSQNSYKSIQNQEKINSYVQQKHSQNQVAKTQLNFSLNNGLQKQKENEKEEYYYTTKAEFIIKPKNNNSKLFLSPIFEQQTEELIKPYQQLIYFVEQLSYQKALQSNNNKLKYNQ